MNPIKWSNESLLHFTFFIHWYLPTHLQFRWRLVLKCTGRENFSSKLSKSTSSASHCAMWLSNDFPYRYYYYESSQPPPPPFNGRQDNHYKMRKPKKNLPIFTRGKGNWKSPPIQKAAAAAAAEEEAKDEFAESKVETEQDTIQPKLRLKFYLLQNVLFGKLRCIFLDRDDADDEGRRTELNSSMDERCVVQVSEQVSGRVAMYATRTNFSGRVLVGEQAPRQDWLTDFPPHRTECRPETLRRA